MSEKGSLLSAIAVGYLFTQAHGKYQLGHRGWATSSSGARRHTHPPGWPGGAAPCVLSLRPPLLHPNPNLNLNAGAWRRACRQARCQERHDRHALTLTLSLTLTLTLNSNPDPDPSPNPTQVMTATLLLSGLCCVAPGEPAWPGHRACGSQRRDCGTPRLARRLRLSLPLTCRFYRAGRTLRAAGRVVRHRPHGCLPGPDVPDELRLPQQVDAREGRTRRR
eukprot:scaffold36534_cov42-Phaeocystis_antarctica.AAC.2